jgi:protein-S-isoprenylcysteine O-methyltransferase Ste14
MGCRDPGSPSADHPSSCALSRSSSSALLVLPWLGFLLNSWLGAVVGLALYAASRRFAPAEERELAENFGPAWTDYTHSVKLPWL